MAQQTPFPPPYQTPQKSRGPLIVFVVLGLVLVLLLAVGGVVLLRGRDMEPAASEATPASKPADPAAVQFRRVITAEPGKCPDPRPDGVFCGTDDYRYKLGKVELDGSNVTDVKPGQSPDGSYWYVGLTLDGEGTRLFSALTQDLAGKTSPHNQLAILVRDQVVSAPVVMTPITGGNVQVSGSNFTQQDVENLAAKITG